MSLQSLSALLALGLTVFVSVPQPAHAQAAQKPVLTTLHTFDGTHGTGPVGTLAPGTDGNFYGVTTEGGIESFGTVFQITPQGQFTTLWRFNLTNGSQPEDGLVRGSDGAFYGTTIFGGTPQGGGGVVFRITPAGRLTTLHTFSYTDTTNVGGTSPFARLCQARDGFFYGSTEKGGAHGYGTLFRITSDGMFTTLHDFSLAEGFLLRGPLVQAAGGALYGTGSSGGHNKFGAVFRITTDGKFITLHSFSGADGYAPGSGLTVGPDGALYGTNAAVYKITLSGKFSVIHRFRDDGHGLAPFGGLTLGPDGNFYGTTREGGTDDRGTLFRMTPQGKVTTLYKFHTPFDGSSPNSGVCFGAEEALYGTTFVQGTADKGTLFKLTLPASGNPSAL